ncbi:MAG TPA: potassium-transporting ATPase subunit KdpC [Symbiobacteriaceae bacterium]|jgi:K+-transporting ATPase ATPase C chain
MLMRSLRFSIVFLVLCGLLYPLATTGLAQLFFPRQARGSLIQTASGQVVGSELIGQAFSGPAFFHGRISSVSYDASSSGSSNLAPSDPALADRVKADVAKWAAENPGQPAPADLLTNSASGLDPDIAPASALAQVPRISRATGHPEVQLNGLVAANIQGRTFGIFGEPRVNVLKLNLALQQLPR